MDNLIQHFLISFAGLRIYFEFGLSHAFIFKLVSALLVLFNDNLLDDLEFIFQLICLRVHFNPMSVQSVHELRIRNLAALIAIEVIERKFYFFEGDVLLVDCR